MKKKMVSVTMCAAMLATLLAGCGGSSTKETTAKETTKETTAATEAAGSTGQTTAAAAEDTIKYVSMWSDTEPQAVTIKEAAAAFEGETGIKVDIEFAGRQGVREGLQPRLDAGEDIDMFDEDIDRVLGQWGDYLLDLTDYINGDYNGKAYIDYINPSFTSIYDTVKTLSKDDTMKAVPYQPFVFDMVYNKAIFKEAGITETPKTWDEQIWQEMYEKGYISEYAATNIYPNAQITEFAPGDAAMYLNGTWLANEIKADVAEGVELGIFAFPKIDGAVNGTEAANYGSQVFAVNKNTKKADKAFQFIAYLTTGEWDQKLSENTLGIPMDAASTWPTELDDAKALFSTLTTRYPWAAGMDDNSDNQATILENFTSVISGSMSAQDFVDKMSK